MKRTKYIPAIITLIGCLAASVITFLNKYDSLYSMLIILAALIIFYIAGLIMKGLADKYLIIEEEIINEEDGKEEVETEDSSEEEAGKEEKAE